MPLFEILLVCAALTGLASTGAFYSYGRFARRARGEPSRALPVADDGTHLDKVIAPLLATRPGQTGMVLLSENLSAFEARVLAARHAQRSLDLQYYYWLGDRTGSLLTQEIIAAAERGVRVRLLIDDINTRGNDRAYLALDAHPNIEIRLFNPSRNRSNGLRRGLELALRAFRATRRMHNKAWIADGRLAIIGGRNIGDAYFDADEATNFHDMDLLLVGPAINGAERVFDDFWNSEAAIPIAALSRPLARKLPRPRRERLRHAATNVRPHVELIARIDAMEQPAALPWHFQWVREVEVVADPPDKALGAAERGWLAERIYRAIAAAEQELTITSPYFIPGGRGVEALGKLTERGASVKVLTNSLAATDVVAVHGAYASYRTTLLRRSVELFELRPDTPRESASLFGSKGASLHTKAFTVDRRMGFIGSFNFDPRSASLNTEMGVFFNDETLIDQMRAIFDRQTQPACAFRVTLEGRRLSWKPATKGPAGTFTGEPAAGPWRRCAALLIRALPIESQL